MRGSDGVGENVGYGKRHVRQGPCLLHGEAFCMGRNDDLDGIRPKWYPYLFSLHDELLLSMDILYPKTRPAGTALRAWLSGVAIK